MPSFGNATIGEVVDPRLHFAAISPLAINGMPSGPQRAMMNAHIGMNFTTSEPIPARAAQLAADQTPGLAAPTGAIIEIVWSVPTGSWAAVP